MKTSIIIVLMGVLGAGYLVGVLAGLAIGSTFNDSKEKKFGTIGLMIAMGPRV